MGWDDSDEDDWDKADLDVKGLNAPKKSEWSDEDVSDDDDDDKPVAASKLPPTEGSGKKKRSLKQILKEREAKEAEKRAELEALEEEEELTAQERKQLTQQQVVDSDLKNAEDLFADVAVDDENGDNVLLMTPTGPRDFKLFGNALVKRLNSMQKVNGYSLFLERLLKGFASELSIEDLNTLTSVLKVITNMKGQEQRKKDGKKKSKRPTLQAAHNNTDDGSRYDDFGDFM